ISAICINQDDPKERSEQVSRIGDIFSLTDRMIVWLGPGDNSSRQALLTLGHLGSRIIMTKSPSYTLS
ncbi:hypothetical protein B0T18DRAFT_313151, partial [Schizothecium vesticola]